MHIVLNVFQDMRDESDAWVVSFKFWQKRDNKSDIDMTTIPYKYIYIFWESRILILFTLYRILYEQTSKSAASTV